MLWVSLGCWFLFVTERFAYNVFDIGVAYHKLPTMFIWLAAMPWASYWLVLMRSSLLVSNRRMIRVSTFGLVALLLAVVFFCVSINMFWTVASWRGVQFW